ncbi:Cytosolic enolase 3-like protein [Drosera capensis]
MLVQDYLDKHMLARRIEDAVNAAVRAKTPDPLLFISNHMRKSVRSVITKVKARRILDGRGVPTVEVELFTNKGEFRASAPGAAASGLYEAIESQDRDKGPYSGNNVAKSVRSINEKVSEALVGMDPTLQSQIDQVLLDLDKTEKKGELGANAILAVSIAACKAGAAEKEVPLFKHVADLSGTTNVSLPVPAFTVISGGKHARNSLAFQEIMVLPVGAKTFEEALQMGSDLYHQLEAVVSEKYGSHGCNVSEVGGFAPNVSRQVFILKSLLVFLWQLYSSFVQVQWGIILPCRVVLIFLIGSFKLCRKCASSIREGLDLVNEAVRRTGLKEEIRIAINVAATEFCIGTTLPETNAPSPRYTCSASFSDLSCTKYDIAFKNSDELGKIFKSAEDLIELYKELCNDYPIVSIEDPFDKEDWEHTEYFSKLQMIQVASGDLLMSNPKHIEKAIQESTCNALLLKVNQVGTVSEAIEAVKLAKDARWGVIISHGSGETEDTFIADLSVGLATGQIKAGAPCGGERLCKYNQLLRIEEELRDQANYTGQEWRTS